MFPTSVAFIIVALFFRSYGSWTNVRYQSSPNNEDNLPYVPGCRLFEREDNLGVSAFCNNFIFPETPSFMPNNTIMLQIYGVYDLDINRPLFKSLVNLRELELPHNGLDSFSSRILEGLPDLRSLGLSGNTIKRLPNDSFVNNPLLEKIDLSKNDIITVSGVTPCLRNLAHLFEVNLSENMIISSLTYPDFAPLRDSPLRSLIFDGCLIDRVDKDAFIPLKNLSSLDLSFTLLGTTALMNLTESLEFSSLRKLNLKYLRLLNFFPVRFFRPLAMSPIEEIDLSFNRFVEFPLTGNIYPYLKSLKLTACNLDDQYFSLDTFKATPNLETLILNSNLFSTLRKAQFAKLTKLKELDVSDPEVASTFRIEDYAFQNLSNLEYLSLEGQPIRQGIARYTFHGLVNLTYLDAARCVIPVIEERAFGTLHNLEILDLSDNLLENLDNDTFYGLRNVKAINLERNMLSTFNRSNPFQHTPVLESLKMSNNKISQFPPGIFDGLFQLGVVKLKNNFITPWHKRLFPQGVNVSFLEINQNRIDYFTPEMLDDVRNLETLDFSYNPLNCSVCGMADLQFWMRNASTRIILLHTVSEDLLPYACVEPPVLANASILDVEIPVAHCIPPVINVVLISLSTVIPFVVCFLIASVTWYFLAWHIRYCCFRVKIRVMKYKQVTKSDRYWYDAFVSYSPSDIQWIREQLMPALENCDHGFRLCVTDRDFETAVNVTANVLGAVENSRTTILVLSNSYLESEWCKFDMDFAQHKLFEDTRSLILILLEDVDRAKMTKNLKYIIKTRTFIPWTNNPVGQRLFWERLRLAVSRPNERVLSIHIT